MLQTTHTSEICLHNEELAAAIPLAGINELDPRYTDPAFLERLDIHAKFGKDVEEDVTALGLAQLQQGASLLRQTIQFSISSLSGKKASVFKPTTAYDPESVKFQMNEAGYRPADFFELLAFLSSAQKEFIGWIIPYAGELLRDAQGTFGIPWGMILCPNNKQLKRKLRFEASRDMFRSDKAAENFFFLGVQQ